MNGMTKARRLGMKYCKECGKPISKYEHEEFEGNCVDCFEELAQEMFEDFKNQESIRRQ